MPVSGTTYMDYHQRPVHYTNSMILDIIEPDSKNTWKKGAVYYVSGSKGIL